jgi:hypothetical protein
MNTALVECKPVTAPPNRRVSACVNRVLLGGVFSASEIRTANWYPAFDRVFKAAKEASEGSLLLFADQFGFVAYREDADAVGEALGIQVTNYTDGLGYDHHQIRLSKQHLARNLKLMAAAGWMYVSIVREDRSIVWLDEQTDINEWDHFLIDQLSQRKGEEC